MYRDSEQVISVLSALDYDLGEIDIKEKVHFCIFGGTAFLFFSDNFRATTDIDIHFIRKILDDKVIKIMNQ